MEGIKSSKDIHFPLNFSQSNVLHICADKGVVGGVVDEVLMCSARCCSPGKALDLSHDPKGASTLAMVT